MTKTDPAPMAPPPRGEEEEEEEEDEPVPEAPSPTQERRQKPVVHPSAPAPLPKDYGNRYPHPGIWHGDLGGLGGWLNSAGDDGGEDSEAVQSPWTSLLSFIHPLEYGVGIILIFGLVHDT